jgi:hypothetical protein
MILNNPELSKKNTEKMKKFVEELFDDHLEIESWISTKETLLPLTG